MIKNTLFVGLFLSSTMLFSMEKDPELQAFETAVQINYALGGKFNSNILTDSSCSEAKKTYAVMEAVRYNDMENLEDLLPHTDVYEKHLRQLQYPEATIKEEVSKLQRRNENLKQKWDEEQ